MLVGTPMQTISFSSSAPSNVNPFTAVSVSGCAPDACSADLDPETQVFTLGAAGSFSGSPDMGVLLYRRVRAGCLLQARVGISAEAAGVVVRADHEPGAPLVAVLRRAGVTIVLARRSRGGPVEEFPAGATAGGMIELEQRGGAVVVSTARFGEIFVRQTFEGFAFGAEVVFGLFAAGGEAQFENVRLVRPAPAEFIPYTDYIGSELELIDPGSGRRTIIHHEDDSLQAPNWTPDGGALICNRNGRIWRFDLAARTMALVDTGAQVKNNNDHAISFDGTMLGISSGDVSRVYSVPIGGGEPKLLTPEGPSYFHSWSPDDKYMIFTAARGGCGPLMSLYRIPAEGGPEERLTNVPGVLDDGSEYTPDGRWIYFNSTRTGRMQIWRMRPDGSGLEQLTFDDTNNWFPHVTPDGKSIVFITYGTDIEPEDHPFYRHVYFRTLPLDGGTPRVVAYVYGGQGSMNVNSWAPDSARFAFVSNSDVL